MGDEELGALLDDYTNFHDPAIEIVNGDVIISDSAGGQRRTNIADAKFARRVVLQVTTPSPFLPNAQI